MRYILLILLLLVGCSKSEYDIVQGDPGPAGPAGSVGEAGQDGEDGADGATGATGAQGPQGTAGSAGSATSVVTYSSGSCISIGSGSYYKSSGSSSKIFDNASCSGSADQTLNKANSTYWLTTKVLAVYENVGKLKILTF